MSSSRRVLQLPPPPQQQQKQQKQQKQRGAPPPLADAESIETRALLAEIRSLLPSEFPTVDRPEPSPFAYTPKFVKELKNNDRLKQAAKVKRLKPKPGADELMQFYMIQPGQGEKVPYSSDKMREKSLLMPYTDTLAMSREKMRLVAEWKVSQMDLEASSEHKSNHNQSDSLLEVVSNTRNAITLEKLARRYPRLCSMLHVDIIDLSEIKVRSGIWMLKFMEECYDEAFSFCYKPVSDSRRRKRCGLDLGALDAFPLVAQRLLTRTYSVLEVRQRVCCEVLISLENIISIGEDSLLKSDIGADCDEGLKSEMMIDGGRAQIFAKFLSEELDLEYLAVYIHCRDLIQKDLDTRLVDTNPHHLLPVEISSGMNGPVHSAAKSEMGVRVGLPVAFHPTESIVMPAHLPSSLRYALDVTMPYAPLLCFDSSKLAWLCGILVPAANLRLRLYLTNKVVKCTEKLFALGRIRLEAISATNAKRLAGLSTFKSSDYIPVSVLLATIIEEWRAVPIDAKANLGEGANIAESLRTLNDIYDGDNAKMKAFAKMIRDIEAELALCDSSLMKLDKTRRRLERKWKNNLASAGEILELQNVRVAQTETKCERTTIETRLQIVRKREGIVKDSLEGLWGAASVATVIEQGPENDNGEIKLAPSRWREDIAGIILTAISYNEEAVGAILRSRELFEKNMQVSAKLDETNLVEVESEPSIDDQIAALERDALELSCLGNAEMIELGIRPPARPEFIQEFVESKQQEAQRRIEKKQELIFENESAIAMSAEEDSMRLFLDHERFFIYHNCRVMQFEEMRMRAFAAEEFAKRKLTASTIADTEMVLIIDGALKGIAHATMIREIEVVLKSHAEAQVMAIEAKALEARVKKSIEVAVGEFISMAKEFAMGKIAEDARSLLVEELMRSRILAISDMATMHVGSMLECAVSDFVHVAVQEMILAQQREREIALLSQRFTVIQEESVTTVSDVISVAYDAASDHFDRLEMEEMMKVEEQIDELATQIIFSQRDLLEMLEVDASVQVAIEMAIDEAVGLEALKQKQAADAARAMRFLVFQSRKIGKSLIAMVINSAFIAAQKVLTDPWLHIDQDPHDFLSLEVLSQVEEMFIIATIKSTFFQKRRLFGAFRYTIISRKSRRQNLLTVWAYMHFLLDDRRHKDEMIRRMQRMVRSYLEARGCRNFAAYLRGCYSRADIVAIKYRKGRAKEYIQFWRYWSHAEHRGKNVTFNIRERRFLICYYTWRLTFKNAMDKKQSRGIICEAAALKIQLLARRKLAYVRCKKIRAHLTLVSLGKRFFARRRMKWLLRKARLQHENFQMQVKHSKIACMRIQYKAWRHSFKISFGLHALHKFTIRKLVRKRFWLWKRGCQNRSKLLHKSATKVQSAVRMWIIKRYVINFYKWRRGIIALQSNGRRRILIPFFCHRLKLARAAKTIQRFFRGFSTRVGITGRRILDLHYAAAANNYDRLRYYARKYPLLLTELDDEGNTALHNAAKKSARRTLKLLLRYQLEPNAVNYAGYTALHLAIISPSAITGECVLYMLERGFDEDKVAPGGKTCLLLAVENARGVIVNQLLANGIDPNTPDDTGLTCLQAACTSGFFGIARELVVYGADVNLAGYCGTMPLHDCIATGNIAFPNMLISHGAYVNVVEPFNQQSPLMWACRAGLAEFVHLYVFQGAHVNAKDKLGWTAAHHGATSDNEDVYEALRVGDADFDAIDHEGNSPLHVAGQCGANVYASALLLGCVNASIQNKDGDQPSHIAARDNNLEVLKRICIYDEHIGRLNFSHRTPLGMAKFYNAPDTRAFLEEHYRKVEIVNGRNAVGDIWWDKDVDAIAEDWKVVVGFLGEREYINEKTGERSLLPPSMNSDVVIIAANFVELPIQRKVVLVDEENALTRHGYKKEYAVFGAEVSAMSRIHRAAICLQKFALRKLAYLELARLKRQKKKLKLIGIFIKRRIKRFMHDILTSRNLRLAKFQAIWRGKMLRRFFFDESGGQYEVLLKAKAKRILGRQLLRVWRSWKREQAIRAMEIAARLPKTTEEWNQLIVEARIALRTVGMYEEYLYPETRKIYFYRHKISHDCTFAKPLKMRAIDEAVFRDAEQIRKFGCTPAQRNLIVKLQALWRGYKIRSYYVYVEAAMNISLNAEKKYMTSPDADSNLYNYALHCHCILHDYTRARSLYYESMRRMEWRGPDVSFVLYSYAIFAMYMHDLDTSDILELLERGRRAEEMRETLLRRAQGREESQAIAKGTFRHGQIFELANIGFFRHYATEHENEGSWHNYALCRFLIFNDFPASFDAFLMAFKYDPSNEKLKANFDTMMLHFHGADKKKQQEIVRNRMAVLAAREVEVHNLAAWRRETAVERAQAGTSIKKWWRNTRNRKRFNSFMELVRAARAAKKRGIL